MNTERERLQANLESTLTILDETNRIVLEKEMETARKLEDLEAVIKRYNSLGYQLSLIPSTATNAKGTDYELTLNIPSQSSNNFRSLPPPSARPQKALQTACWPPKMSATPPYTSSTSTSAAPSRQAFLSLRKEISQRRKEALEKDLNDREIIDKRQRGPPHEKSNEIETLSHRVSEANRAYNSLKESSSVRRTCRVFLRLRSWKKSWGG